MAFNEALLQHIKRVLADKGVTFTEKKMFSGVCIMVDDKMCCGTHIDKKTGEDLLLCRVGEETYERVIEQNDCIPIEFTGKPMKGFVYVRGNALKTNEGLNYWLQLCLDFNPHARKSKK